MTHPNDTRTCLDCGEPLTSNGSGTKRCRRCYSLSRMPSVPGPNPSGVCLCGCGQRTSLATETRSRHRWVKGTPICYITGHRHSPVSHDGTPVIDASMYRVEDHGFETPCWIWQRSKKNGYGIVSGRKRAHRVSYEARFGPIPNDREPDHLCKQKACINPEHLEPVSHTENVRRGPHTRITMEIAREIRSLAAEGRTMNTEIAQRFGVSKQTVGLIVKERQWREAA